MCDKKFFEILSDNINYVILDNKKIIGSFEILLYLDKYSSVKKKTNRLFIDGCVVKTKNKKVSFVCDGCNDKSIISLKKYLLKTNHICSLCKNNQIDKRLEHSEYIKKCYSDNNKVIPKVKKKTKIINENNKTFIEKSNLQFEKETDSYKNIYYKKHLRLSEYLNIKDKIYSINGIVLKNDIEYFEHLKTNNQMKYSSYIYDSKYKKFTCVNNVKLFCDNCNKLFNTTRKIKSKIHNLKILCPKCYLCNRTFKIRNVKNIKGEKITYQSKPELKLVNYCNNNNILIEDGPVINYNFNNKILKYYTDYYIPSIKTIIEIKDNHIWHKEQVKTGKWDQKEKNAKIYAKENNINYLLLFTDNFEEFLKLL